MEILPYGEPQALFSTVKTEAGWILKRSENGSVTSSQL
jgi:hypothetical protein